MNDDELRARLETLVRRSATELRRARKAVMRALDDGTAHFTASLVTAAAVDLGADTRLTSLSVRLPDSHADSPLDIPADEPSVLLARARLAGQSAVAGLAHSGCIVPAVIPVGPSAHESHAASALRFVVTTPRQSGSVDVSVLRYDLAAAYVRERTAATWFLDPDVFLEDLAALPLDARAVGTLREALESFRRGLYLATATLLGVVSEAAWYAAAGKLGRGRALEEPSPPARRRRSRSWLRTASAGCVMSGPRWTRWLRSPRSCVPSATTGCILGVAMTTWNATSPRRSAAC
jgi:hypothetical protein